MKSVFIVDCHLSHFACIYALKEKYKEPNLFSDLALHLATDLKTRDICQQVAGAAQKSS